MIYELMHFLRRVVRVLCGRRVGGGKAVDKAMISSVVALGRAPDIPARIL